MAETKLCMQCGTISGPKPLDDFYKHPQTADGRMARCKDCTKANVKAYAQANPDKVRKLCREKMRRPKYRRRNKRWRKENPEAAKAIRDRWAEKNKDKRKAEWTVSNALRDGKIQKPSHCQRCHKKRKVESHHPDYSKPLEVEWLCSKCHGETRIKDGPISPTSAL